MVEQNQKRSNANACTLHLPWNISCSGSFAQALCLQESHSWVINWFEPFWTQERGLKNIKISYILVQTGYQKRRAALPALQPSPSDMRLALDEPRSSDLTQTWGRTVTATRPTSMGDTSSRTAWILSFHTLTLKWSISQRKNKVKWKRGREEKEKTQLDPSPIKNEEWLRLTGELHSSTTRAALVLVPLLLHPYQPASYKPPKFLIARGREPLKSPHCFGETSFTLIIEKLQSSSVFLPPQRRR